MELISHNSCEMPAFLYSHFITSSLFTVPMPGYRLACSSPYYSIYAIELHTHTILRLSSKNVNLYYKFINRIWIYSLLVFFFFGFIFTMNVRIGHSKKFIIKCRYTDIHIRPIKIHEFLISIYKNLKPSYNTCTWIRRVYSWNAPAEI